jgi:hypothetical protein
LTPTSHRLTPEQALALLREHGFNPAGATVVQLLRWINRNPHFPVKAERLVEAFVRPGS